MINRKIKIPKDTKLSKDVLDFIISEHRMEKNRIDKLEACYNNHAEIFERKYENDGKPHNMLASPYAHYITTMAVGYFLGKPVKYKAEEGNEKNLEIIQDIFKYNDEHDHNTTLAKKASIGGYAVELLYIDENTNARFRAFGGNEVAIVYDDTIEDNIILAIRYWDEKLIGQNITVTRCEIYTPPIKNDKGGIIETGKILYGTIDAETFYIDETKTKEHFFSDVPVVVYTNNDELYGDFEKVMSLINAYNKAQSDTANDFEYFTNAILVISGFQLPKDEDGNAPRDFRTIEFSDNTGDAKYLMKDIQDGALENYKNRLDKDIHAFSLVPKMTDEAFAGNISGEAMKYKLMGLDTLTATKESKFRKGLLRRIELLFNYMKMKDSSAKDSFIKIEPIFSRNRPVNELEISQMMQTLTGILSKETVLSLHPTVTDVQVELEKIEKENEMPFEQEYTPFAEKQEPTKESEVGVEDAEQEE